MTTDMKVVDSIAAFLRLALTLVLVALATGAPARADEYTNNEALDALFAALRDAQDARAAQAIDQRIWFYWFNPVDPALASRMSEVVTTRSRGGIADTIEVLDAIIEDYPGYAEAWNQRATMYYMLGNYPASIADCEKVLELEPRHFGALSGRATMYLNMGKRALALKDMAAAVEIHPFLAGRALFPELLRDVTRI
jgi:tetratricopeptide (TPR) repeat protein